MKGKLTRTSKRQPALKLPARLNASVQKKNNPYEEAAVGDKVWVIKDKAFSVVMEKLPHETFRLKNAAGEINLPADQVSLPLSGSGDSIEEQEASLFRYWVSIIKWPLIVWLVIIAPILLLAASPSEMALPIFFLAGSLILILVLSLPLLGLAFILKSYKSGGGIGSFGGCGSGSGGSDESSGCGSGDGGCGGGGCGGGGCGGGG